MEDSSKNNKNKTSMGRKKIEIKYIQDRLTRQVAFSRRRIDIFKKADALAELCNVEVAVLINTPTGRPFVFGSPCFNSVVGRFRYPFLMRSERSSPSLKQARILKSRENLDRLLEELKQHKEHKKVLKVREEEILKTYDIKKIVDLKLEGLAAFKEKLEAVRDNMKRKCMEVEADRLRIPLAFMRKKMRSKGIRRARKWDKQSDEVVKKSG